VTSLLMVMTFVLTIFIVVQYVLREEISGQRSQLDRLTSEISGLTEMLGLSDAEVDRLEAETARQFETISALEDQTGAQEGRIASFERQVASLLAERDRAASRIGGLEDLRDTLMSEQEALTAALSRARAETDAEAEAARLAAARADALDALAASLRADAAAQDKALATLEDALSAKEQARLSDAAAAEALRARLREAGSELTDMTLALEEERRAAEETLTLLAAARAAESDMTERLTAALLAQDATDDDLNALRAEREGLTTRLAAAEDRADALEGVERDLAAATGARSAAETEADRTRALLQAALRQNEAQTAEMVAISDALDAAKAARVAFQGDLEAARAAVAAAEADLADLRARAGQEADERDRLAAALDAARAEAAALQGAAEAETDLRDQLEQALALKVQAESAAAERLTEAERQAALLATARAELSDAGAASAADRRRIEALNGQIAQLRRQLGSLQSLLDTAAADDAESDARIESLGEKLNAALARQAREQTRIAELEAAERERLERIAELEAAERARLERYQSEFFGRLRDVLGDREGVQIVGDRFVFDSEVLFPSGSAILAPAGRVQVARVARLLEDVADEIPDTIDWVIRVDGHTDDVPLSGNGRYSDNWQLSQARALSVVRFMAEDLGFPAWRLAPTGFGEYRPVDPRRTPEARARNRRIELKLTER